MTKKLLALAVAIMLSVGGVQQALAGYWGKVTSVEVRDSTDFVCTVAFEFQGINAYSYLSGKFGFPSTIFEQGHRSNFSRLLTAYMTGNTVAIWVPIDGDGFITQTGPNECANDGDGTKAIDKLLNS